MGLAKSIIGVLIFIGIVYVGVLVGLPWGKYLMLKSAFDSLMKEEKFTHQYIMKNLKEQMKDLHIPYTDKTLKYEDEGNTRKYIITYKESVKFPYVNKTITFDFKLEGEKRLRSEE